MCGPSRGVWVGGGERLRARRRAAGTVWPARPPGGDWPRGVMPRSRGVMPVSRGVMPKSRGVMPKSRGVMPKSRGVMPKPRGVSRGVMPGGESSRAMGGERPRAMGGDVPRGVRSGGGWAFSSRGPERSAPSWTSGSVP